MLIEFNKYFLKTIPYVMLDDSDITKSKTGEKKKTATSDEKLNDYFIASKGLVFTHVKTQYIRNIVNNLNYNYDQPEVKIKRRKGQMLLDAGGCDHKGEITIFGQIY